MSDIGPNDRPVDLSGVPASPVPPRPGAAPSPASPQPGAQAGQQSSTQSAAQAAPAGGFDFNQPTIVSLLYISSFVLGFTAIVAVVLAYVWKDQTQAPWEASHYRYHIRTFWIAVIGTFVSIPLMFVLIGFFLWLATAVLVVVRSILSLLNAQKREPMPNPETWLA